MRSDPAGHRLAVDLAIHQRSVVTQDSDIADRTNAADLRRGPGRGRRLKIAMLAPPWIPVPPRAYGGIENVVSLLTDELAERGHEVVLYCTPGSRSAATTHPVLAAAHPDNINEAAYEVDHVARALASIDRAARVGRGFDVIHDHCGWTALAMADRVSTPIVHTMHGPFTPDQFEFYAEHGHKGFLVAISKAQLAEGPRHLRGSAVVPNPIVVEQWPLRHDKDDYLLWVGRFNADKGPHRAIKAARLAGRPLLLAGPVQPGQEPFFATEIEPHLDGATVTYIGEIGGLAKREVFARASALLMPIRWNEPFGMVMVEALACGTPVIAFPEGSAPEIVLPGVNGFLVEDEVEMAGAVGDLTGIDADQCRASVAARFDVEFVADGYERAYRRAIAKFEQRPRSDERTFVKRTEETRRALA